MYPIPLFRLACEFTEMKEDEADRIKDMLYYLEKHHYDIEICAYDRGIGGEWELSIRHKKIAVYNNDLTLAIERMYKKVKNDYEGQKSSI